MMMIFRSDSSSVCLLFVLQNTYLCIYQSDVLLLSCRSDFEKVPMKNISGLEVSRQGKTTNSSRFRFICLKASATTAKQQKMMRVCRKNDNDLRIMVSFVTKRDININIFRTTFTHHFFKKNLSLNLSKVTMECVILQIMILN